MENPVIQTMLSHKSVRKYTKQKPTDETIQTIVRAGQQAPFASQLYSVLLTRKKAPFGAPLWFTICVDLYKLERFMKLRGWEVVTNDLSLLFFGIQDAAYMAENMVVAGESLGLFSCFLGDAPYLADKIARDFKLPHEGLPAGAAGDGLPGGKIPTPAALAAFVHVVRRQVSRIHRRASGRGDESDGRGLPGAGLLRQQKPKSAWKKVARKPSPTRITPGPSTFHASGANGTSRRRSCWSSWRRGDLSWGRNRRKYRRLMAPKQPPCGCASRMTAKDSSARKNRKLKT